MVSDYFIKHRTDDSYLKFYCSNVEHMVWRYSCCESYKAACYEFMTLLKNKKKISLKHSVPFNISNMIFNIQKISSDMKITQNIMNYCVKWSTCTCTNTTNDVNAANNYQPNY